MTRQINVGGVLIGGGAPVVIQSMLNTKTTDVEGSLNQIRQLADAGCQIARLAVPNMEAARGFAEICKESPLPLVADIHFDYKLAIAAAEGGASKIRINPGNIGGEDRGQAVVAVCKEKIIEHNIEMKLIDVEYTFDNNKLLFYFTADGRVDFRELVKDLASIFRTRIELRQIGIRDEAKLMGGLGVCGRPFCCHSFLSDFVQVSIKMAKEQNLSLNSAKISGTCGRLMCCLRYEYDVYEEEIRKTPKMDAVVETPDGEAVVCEVIPLAGLVRVKFLGNHSDMPPKLFHRDDVSVKGKMNWKSGTVTYLDEQK